MIPNCWKLVGFSCIPVARLKTRKGRHRQDKMAASFPSRKAHQGRPCHRILSKSTQKLEHRLFHHVSSGTIVSNGVSGLRPAKSLARLSANIDRIDVSPEPGSKGVLGLCWCREVLPWSLDIFFNSSEEEEAVLSGRRNRISHANGGKTVRLILYKEMGFEEKVVWFQCQFPD